MNRPPLLALLVLLATIVPARAGIGPVAGVWKDPKGTVILASRQGAKIKFVPGKGGDFTVGSAELISDNGTVVRFSATFEKGAKPAGKAKGAANSQGAKKLNGTYNRQSDKITWEQGGGGPWERHVDPKVAKLQRAQISAEVQAANQRAALLEQMLNENAQVSADAVGALQSQLAELMNARQATEAERDELAKALERLQAKSEEKKVVIPDEPVSLPDTAYTAPVGTTGTAYSVSEYWASRWNDKGNWVLGGRKDKKVVSIDIGSPDQGATLAGSFAYDGEGPVDFKATRVSGSDYKVQIRWGGVNGAWRDEPIWKIGDRPEKPLVRLNATSKDGGMILEGTMTYQDEGSIGFRGTAK